MIQGMKLNILLFLVVTALLLGSLLWAFPVRDVQDFAVGISLVALLVMTLYAAYINSQVPPDALKVSEERLRLAIRGTNDGVYDWNLLTQDLYWSPQFKAMLGYQENEIEADPALLESMMHPDDWAHALDITEQYLSRTLPELSCIFRLKHKDGHWVWIQKRGRALFDEDGRPVRLAGTYSDVSSLKEYEERLEEAKNQAEKANAAKTEFLAHMSHEIRTPLTSISGVAEILMSQKKDFNTKQQQLIKVLSYSTINLKELINDILDFSKIESGQMVLEEKTFALAGLFQEIISTMAVRAQEKGLKFSFNYADVADIAVISDKIRLRQVLMNLIGNALKFTHQGAVKVTAKRQEKEGMPFLEIEVRDTGIGIDSEHFDIIFERFRQADPSVSRKYGGTGLGLAISKNLVECMGGTITLASVVGEGSVFTVMLPLHVATASDKNALAPQKMRAASHPKTDRKQHDHILLVEDYEGNIAVLGYILESGGYDFEIARTGLQAVNLWKSQRPDLILMDVQMPEMDGLTATRQIRKIEQEQGLPHTPIIGMTAHAFVEDKDKCVQAGMDSYLAKPITEIDLVTEISKYLPHHQKRRASNLH